MIRRIIKWYLEKYSSFTLINNTNYEEYLALKEIETLKKKIEKEIIDRDDRNYFNNLISCNEAHNLYRNIHQKGLFDNCEISL